MVKSKVGPSVGKENFLYLLVKCIEFVSQDGGSGNLMLDYKIV
jgi:hypothetical protein